MNEDKPTIVIVWDPQVMTPDEYAQLVVAIGNVVRSQGGIGIERLHSATAVNESSTVE